MKERIILKIIFCLLICLNILTISISAALPTVSSEEGIYLLDDSTGTVIFEQNEDKKFAPASITKLMTALIMVENIKNIDEIVTVGNEVNDFTYEDSRAMLWEGQKLSYRDLLNAMLIPSGNDAAQTIAINVGKIISGSQDRATAEQAFYDAMNKKAQELGMLSSHFSNPHGRSADDHYTTAKDYVQLAKAALSNDLIRQAASAKRYTLKNQDGSDNVLFSSNFCLYINSDDMNGYPGINNVFPVLNGNQPNPYYSSLINGAKTGSADNGARSYAFYSDQDENQIYGVILNSMNPTGIFTESRDLLSTIDSKYQNLNVNSILDQQKPIEIKETSILSPDQLEIKTDGNFLFDEADQTDTMKVSYRFNNDLIKSDKDGYTLVNSIKENQKVGSVLISNSSGITNTIPIYAVDNYYSKNIIDWIIDNSLYIGIGLIIIITVIILFIRFNKEKPKVKF